MSSTIYLKKSAVPGKKPVLSDLDYGELAINIADGKLYARKVDVTNGDTIIAIGGESQGANARLDELVNLAKTNSTLVVQDESGNLKAFTIESDDLNATISTGHLNLSLKAIDGLTPGSVGSLTKIPVLTINEAGQITSYTTADISTSFDNITAKPTTLSGYGITDSINISQKGNANGLATLDITGKLPTSQLPALAITDTFVVGSEEEMLLLTVQRGDVAIRTDIKRNFILAGDDSNLLSNWLKLEIPVDAVTSVNGHTNTVILEPEDIGAAPEIHDHTSITGNAGSATKLATTRKIAIAGGAVGEVNFDGTTDVSVSVELQVNATGALAFNKDTNALTVVTADGLVAGVISAADYNDLKSRQTAAEVKVAIEAATASLDGGSF